MGTQSTWGLISRVSSRTYREQSNMFTSIASRALRTSVARQNKLKFYGGDGQNVLAKALTLALHHNKNGNIKYRVYKTQMTGLKLDSDLWLVGCMAFFWAVFTSTSSETQISGLQCTDFQVTST